MGFKEDADFARFVSMGAVGAAAVAHHLSTEHSHRMIELERYAMANKVWQTKVKRLRLPDLLCVRCGLRVEARAKSKLGIVLSHSDTAGREWDAGGMRGNDLFAFLRADLGTFPPSTSLPSFFATEDLRATVGHARRSAAKAASEGSEVTLTWPCWVPSNSGTYLGTNDHGYGLYRSNRGNRLTYWQWRDWPCQVIEYLDHGGPCEGGETIIAGIVPALGTLKCPGDVWDPSSAIAASDATDRYAGIKAAGARERHDLQDQLLAVLDEFSLDWRIRLEAAVSLTRLDAERWIYAATGFVNDSAATLEQRMEAVLALSELPARVAAEVLREVASDASHFPELRAAATWGLGQGEAAQPELLLEFMLDDEVIVALHGVAAIDTVSDTVERVLVEWLNGDDRHRGDVAAYLLSRHQHISPLLDACEHGGRGRVRALSALGRLPRVIVAVAAGDRLTSDLTRLVEPMWHSQESWIETSGIDGLAALEVQKVRFSPVEPGIPWEPGTT